MSHFSSCLCITSSSTRDRDCDIERDMRQKSRDRYLIRLRRIQGGVYEVEVVSSYHMSYHP